MKLIFEVYTHPGSFELEDEILNVLNDDGFRDDVEIALKCALERIMHFQEIRIAVKLKEWI